MTIASIRAIRECMIFLKLRFDQRMSDSIHCFVRNGAKKGPISVQFLNDVHAHEGTYIAADYLIRGFGISQEHFKPAFNDFTFHEADGDGILTCSNEHLTFQLEFQRENDIVSATYAPDS